MTKGLEIYFTAGLAGENGDYEDLRPLHGGRLETVWDGYRDLTAWGDAKIPVTAEQFFKVRVLQGSNRGIIPILDRPKIIDDPIERFQEIWDTGEDLLRLSLWDQAAVERYKMLFIGWLALTAKEAEGVGGDDSYFDYYPDRWFVARQIAHAIPGLKKFYNQYRAEVINGRYKDDPEIIAEY